MTTYESCRNFDPWSCAEDEYGDPVDPNACRVCGLTRWHHEHRRPLVVDEAMLARDRIAKLEAEVVRLRRPGYLPGALEELEAEVERLRHALGCYADESNWGDVGRRDPLFVWEGDGDAGWTIARKALGLEP